MFSKDTFITLVKKANHIHWSASQSSMRHLINAIPDNGLTSQAHLMTIQSLIWPVGDNPVWRQKKKKYKEALIYLATQVLSMPRQTAERVLLKKGEQKRQWEERPLANDMEFTHATAVPLTQLDPRKSREFCYPADGMWYDWPANEFVFCKPKRHGQKSLSTFGGTTLEFEIPAGTPYFGTVNLATIESWRAAGEVAFYHTLILTGGTVQAVLPT